MIRLMKEQMVDLVLLSGNKEELRKLEGEMEINFGFVMDNGKEITRKRNESLGAYIERYTVSLMKNFSRKKYEKLKTMCGEYNTIGDSRIVEKSFEVTNIAQKVNAFGKMSESIEQFINGIFRKPRRAA